MQKYEAICSRTFLKCKTSYSGWMKVHPGGGVKAVGGADSGGGKGINLAVRFSTSHTSQLKASSRTCC